VIYSDIQRDYRERVR